MNALQQIVERMSCVHALVVGDAIVDRYFFGRVERLCPEAPVPAFVPEVIESRYGGAWHVEQQLRALEAKPSGMFGHPMSMKTRYMVGHQMLLRVDDDRKPICASQDVVDFINKEVLGERQIDVIILSDYSKGMLTPEVCKHLIDFGKTNDIPVVVDPKGIFWQNYEGCTWICPNWHELSAAYKFWDDKKMLVKQGAHGLQVRVGASHYPTSPAVAQHVYDVTGAGDTVVAVFAAAIAVQADPLDAAKLANIAAGWCVGEVGTVCVSKEKLLELCDETD